VNYYHGRDLAPPDCEDVGFHADLVDWQAKRGRPAIVAIIRNPATGEKTGGIHRTYLTDDCAAKADIEKPKMMLGPSAGVVMLAPIGEDGVLGVAEGIETSIAAAMLFNLPVWAALSAGNMRRFTPPPGLRKLWIFADHGTDGEKSAAELQARLGAMAEIVMPLSDDDFAKDLVLGLVHDELPQPTAMIASQPEPAEVPDGEIIFPPRTCEEILDFIGTIDRHMTDGVQNRMVRFALSSVARAGLDAISERQCLVDLKARTGITFPILDKELKATRRKLGLGNRSTTATPEVTEICRRYVYVKAVAALWDRQTRTIVSLDAVRHSHWAEMPLDDYGEPADPRDVLLKGKCGQVVDRVDTITFMPASPEIFTEENGATALNIWMPPDVVAVPGDASPFIEHINYVVDGDSTATGYALDFLAHLVQKPWLKIKCAILIIGKPGIGKSLIGEMIASILGQSNTTAVEESDLRSQFNEWMDGKQLVIVNELMTVDRQETMNRLKSYITDPRIRINRKLSLIHI